MDKYEKIVYDWYNTKSKYSVASRFQDALDATKRSGFSHGIVPMGKNPSDFVITDNGETFYAEVKHTENPQGVTRALFEKQRVFRDRILMAQGDYRYFVYSNNVHQWYCIPGEVIRDNPNSKWKELGKYMITYLKGVY